MTTARTRCVQVGRLTGRVEFKPQDLWVGLYWQRRGLLVDGWVCVVPMVPIHFWYLRRAEGH